jgi:cell division cycle protein 37
MPLNYAKWERIEVRLFAMSPLLTTALLQLSLQLSDDSDIEDHPDVDKQSLIRSVFLSRNRCFHQLCRRSNQRHTHEKRKERNHRIEKLSNEVAGNEVLLGRLRVIQQELVQSDSSCFSSEVDRLRTNPSAEAPPTDTTNAIWYENLLQTIAKEVQKRAESDKGKLLEEQLEFHVDKLKGITEELRNERDALLKEKSKYITMDDLNDGFQSKVLDSFGGSFFIPKTFSTISTVRSPQTRAGPGDS